jgi:hypothetical protein
MLWLGQRSWNNRNGYNDDQWTDPRGWRFDFTTIQTEKRMNIDYTTSLDISKY